MCAAQMYTVLPDGIALDVKHQACPECCPCLFVKAVNLAADACSA